MSSRSSKPIHFKCVNDCARKGCPGHELVLKHHLGNDLIELWIDGKICETYAENKFGALMSAFIDLGRTAAQARMADAFKRIMAQQKANFATLKTPEDIKSAMEKIGAQFDKAVSGIDHEAIIAELEGRKK